MSFTNEDLVLGLEKFIEHERNGDQAQKGGQLPFDASLADLELWLDQLKSELVGQPVPFNIQESDADALRRMAGENVDLTNKVELLKQHMYQAWILIANACNGWGEAEEKWIGAAMKWRGDFHREMNQGDAFMPRMDLGVKEALAQLLGYTSVCWTNPAGAGIFQAELVEDAMNNFLQWLDKFDDEDRKLARSQLALAKNPFDVMARSHVFGRDTLGSSEDTV